MIGVDDIPWKSLDTDIGPVPIYVIEYDKNGGCRSPIACDAAVAASRDYTDVFVFSHGWNNDWPAATQRYERFIAEFDRVRRARWNPTDRDFRPLLIGIFWPSAILVGAADQAPDIAAADVGDFEIELIADELGAGAARDRFLSLVADRAPDRLLELAGLLAPLLDGDDDVPGRSDPPGADELHALWLAAGTTSDDRPGSRGGFIDDAAPPAPVRAAPFAPATAFRDAVRATTVWLMKDRSGRVGARGVGELLRQLADVAERPRVALAGHSYGCKVVLSALCAGAAPSRPVDSILLLEPALSCYAFTDNLDGVAGGYRSALDRVRLPIVSTYSRHDKPLRDFFHLAVRRRSDEAEAVIAAEPPSRYAALGGYGPYGVDADRIAMPAVGEPYPLNTSERVIAVDGTAYIASHGAVESPETAWALLCQVRT